MGNLACLYVRTFRTNMESKSSYTQRSNVTQLHSFINAVYSTWYIL